MSDIGPAHRLDRESFGVDAWTFLDYAGVFSFRQIKKFTALADGEFAGFAASQYDPQLKAVCIMTLAVRPEFRMKGIGTALLKHCEDSFSVSRFYLNVDIENQPAICLYKKAGYRQTGIDRAYYLNGHDGIVMEKLKDKND